MTKKEFYNTLSDDVKAKIKACKSEQEMLDVLGKEGIALDPDLLEGVAGGMCKNEYYSACPDSTPC